MRKVLLAVVALVVLVVAVALLRLRGGGAPLRIAYSDWPGWVAWEVAIQQEWFDEEGVDVEFIWFEYVPSMEAFAAGKVDAVSMTNGDAMVTGAAGRKSTAVVINDFSNGNDMVIGRPGLGSIQDLRGKKVGVELNFVDHLLLLKALELHGMSEQDVTLVNMPTNDTPQALAAGGVDAIAAWNPVSAQTLTQVPGSTALFTSREVPGLIFDALYVDRTSLAERRPDWVKIAKVWFRCVEFIRDPATQPEALQIMSARVDMPPERYQRFLEGTFLLDLPGNLRAYRESEGLESIYGSSQVVNLFNVAKRVYEEPQDVPSYLDPTVVEALSASSGVSAGGGTAGAP